jgi:hypothetical protein
MSKKQDKPAYEAPKVLMLDKGNAAIGNCNPGSGDLDACWFDGNTAKNICHSDGSSPQGECNSLGNSPS